MAAIDFGKMNMVLETIGENTVAAGADKVSNKLDDTRKSLAKFGETIGKTTERVNFLTGALGGLGLSQMSGLGTGAIGEAAFGKIENRTGTGQFLSEVSQMTGLIGGSIAGQKLGTMIGASLGPMGAIVGSIAGSVVADFVMPKIMDLGDLIENKILNPGKFKTFGELTEKEQAEETKRLNLIRGKEVSKEEAARAEMVAAEETRSEEQRKARLDPRIRTREDVDRVTDERIKEFIGRANITTWAIRNNYPNEIQRIKADIEQAYAAYQRPFNLDQTKLIEEQQFGNIDPALLKVVEDNNKAIEEVSTSMREVLEQSSRMYRN